MTERVIVYSGQVPLETDVLRTNKNMMISISKLAASMLGSSTMINGLTCSPSAPDSLNVVISAGEMYSLANIDGTPYSSISADTTHTILKQGVLLDSTTLTITPPTTAGFSINYLVQFAFQEVDTDSITLAYYNAANPSQAWSGPGGSGTAQNTTRSGTISISLKAGIAAATGSQSTPSADTGYTPAWVVTVANGQTTINSSSITRVANAPFMPANGILKSIQSGEMQFGTDAGTTNAYSVRLTPGLSSLTDGMRISFRPANSNTGSSTLNVSSLGAQPLVNSDGSTLLAGQLLTNSIATVMWNATLSSWMLLSSSSGRLIGTPQIFTNSGTYTKSPGVTKIIVEIIGGGGGSKSVTADSSSTGGSQPGCGGQYNKSLFMASAVPSSVSVTIGNGGTPGNGGGQSLFGSLITVDGGSAGADGMTSAGAFISGSAYRFTGLVNTSSGSVLASSGGEAQSPQVMQVSAGTATGFVSYPSPFPGGTFGRGADGRYVGAGTTSTGLSGNKGVCIVYEYS